MNFSERNFQRHKILVSVYLSSPLLHTYLPSLYVLYFLHLPGHEIAVYEGDILLRRGRRSAINCESCLWPKSQDGLVKVPVNISSDFCECMQMDALKLALIFHSLYSCYFMFLWHAPEETFAQLRIYWHISFSILLALWKFG